MVVFVLAGIIAAVYYYLKALSKDNSKLYVDNVWLERPKGLEFITSGYNVQFWKPIGKHELHAFTSINQFSLSTDIYLGKVHNNLSSRLMGAIDRGGENFGFVFETTSTNRLHIIYEHKSRYNSTNFWGFINKRGFEHIERSFGKDFNLNFEDTEGKSKYRIGIIENNTDLV